MKLQDKAQFSMACCRRQQETVCRVNRRFTVSTHTCERFLSSNLFSNDTFSSAYR